MVKEAVAIPPELQAMFDKEKQEHDELDDATIWQIVLDHLDAGVSEAWSASARAAAAAARRAKAGAKAGATGTPITPNPSTATAAPPAPAITATPAPAKTPKPKKKKAKKPKFSGVKYSMKGKPKKPKAQKVPKPKVVKPLKPPSKPKKLKAPKNVNKLSLREWWRKIRRQGKYTDGPTPPDAGSPANPYWPQEALKPGWTPVKQQAAVENRTMKAIKRGVPHDVAHAEALHFTDLDKSRGGQAPDIYIHNHFHGHSEGNHLAGIVHRHPHAHVRGEAHPDPRHHVHDHTGSPSDQPIQETLQESFRWKLEEKFSWVQPFKEIVKEAGRRLVRGVAITVGKSRNDSKYSADELMRGARTLADKPFYVNHLETPEQARAYLAGKHVDPSGQPEGPDFDPATIPPAVRDAIKDLAAHGDMRAGKVQDSEFEDGGVEYEGAITHPPTMAVVDHDPPLVKGVSIGAFPRNRNLNNPKGIMFSDLSLITDPETPGDPDADLKTMEKMREMVLVERQPDIIDVIEVQQRAVVREQLRRVETQIAKHEATS